MRDPGNDVVETHESNGYILHASMHIEHIYIYLCIPYMIYPN